jgi:nitrite reductase (NADH) small subunit
MSETLRWVRTARCEDIPLHEARSVRFGEREIAIFNLGDRFLAVDNRCPHKGGPRSDGIVAGSAVVCPLHAWRVNLDSGEVERPCAAASPVETYSVRVDDGMVRVALGPRRQPGVPATVSAPLPSGQPTT